MILNLVKNFVKPERSRPDICDILPSLNRKESPTDIARAYGRLFSTADGRRVLEHLQLTTLYRAQSPDASDAQIRHLEGQRFVVFQILRQIERGRAGS